eukprot:1805533-Heterocapsa_arctica.AAC.1
MEASTSYKPTTTAVEGDMCAAAVAMRARAVRDNTITEAPGSPRYSPASPSKGRSCYVLSSRSDEDMKKDAEGAERRRL